MLYLEGHIQLKLHGGHMQDDIKVKAQDYMRRSDARLNRSRYAAANSRRRVQRRIDDILEARLECIHQRTRTTIEPDSIEADDRVLEGTWYKTCRDCLKTVEWAS